MGNRIFEFKTFERVESIIRKFIELSINSLLGF